MTVQKQLEEAYLIPVVIMDDAARAVDTARALIAGGIKVMEITLRTEAGLDSIEKAAKACPGLLVGGGTVLSLEQCRQAVMRGAAFIVSPGYDPGIVDYCHKNNIMVIPGCVTPTEITIAMADGIDIIKFFPANAYGGIKAIKALSGPFPHIKFVPTGGIDLSNLTEYVIPQVFAIGGGWLCDRKTINTGNYEEITRICVNSLDIVKKTAAVYG
ncbi:MAG: bifunctional 4-hydroxy-2-oxoglutarate aldolase/2-dehydro-3-deoxy-phosphogluconate aldolase [Treponema sp.]|jgi:2-dehydro-3-deoxyphosphogluconate aldolase/(4S)-4-hydroxy-2-oxoglutarate aldolase|nr:bifunctional 4-hydroxy-2-oxoglutarate aldolase/2-dehydro-3-deoxy-phosphogluconate aldolase [Treponema sp.]